MIRLFESCRNTERQPACSQVRAACSASHSPSSAMGEAATAGATVSRSTARRTASMSRSTWATGRRLNRSPLYRPQKVQRFQGQLRVTRTSRLSRSLGGRIGPCSKPR
jgi:hypothetical protein